MNGTFLTRGELTDLLVRSGQIPAGDAVRGADVDVDPSPDVLVTVAANLDPFHDPACRERYFVTLLDRDDGRPLLRHHPAFALPAPFAKALDREPVGGRDMRGNFLLGPFRWLARRLAQFPRCLVWPERQIRPAAGFVTGRWALDEMPALRGWLEAHGPWPPDVGAIVLDPADVADCRVLWEVAEQVEAGFYDYFVSDGQALEVFRVQHHSKVLVSILDPSARQRLLDELSSHPDVLEDCSGSGLDWGDIDRAWDEEDEEPGPAGAP